MADANPQDYNALIGEINEYSHKLLELIPDVMHGFGQLSDAAQKDNALDRKTKELMALSLAVGLRCEGCIAFHARGAHRHGATRQEVAEAVGVAIQMGGGPAVNLAADALRAFDQFASKGNS